MDYLPPLWPGKSSISWDDNVSGLCPHCHEELELDISLIDWAKSQDTEFECPHCGGEFDWKEFHKWKGPNGIISIFRGFPLLGVAWIFSLFFTIAALAAVNPSLDSFIFLVFSLLLFLFTTFIQIRNLFPFLPWWHLGVGIAAGIALIAIISFGWPALLVVGIVLIIYAAIGWAKE